MTSPLSPSSLRRLLFAALVAAASLSLLAAPIASAQAVPQLATQVTDQAGVVGGGKAQLDSALADLQTKANVQLWVAFIRTTGGETAQSFAEATFQQNGLGGNDLLLVVAVDDHRYGWWDDGAAPALSSQAVDGLMSGTMEARFRAGDYAGGVAAFAGALEGALTTAPITPAAPTPAPTSGDAVGPAPAADFGSLALVLLAVVVLVVLVLLVAAARARWVAHLSAEERDRRTGQLARDANAALIAADDAVRESTQDLAFAEAQFDEPDLAPLRTAIETARGELKAAFTVRQRLDDSVPETPEERERMLTEILQRSRGIDAALAEQRKRIQALREQEQKAPELLAALPAQVAALRARVPEAEATLKRLEEYPAESVKPVVGNVEEARKRLADSDAEADRGRAALAATPPDAKGAARSVRRVVGALAEATTLLDAIDHLAAMLDDARSRVDGEITAAAADLEAAKSAAGSAPSADAARHLGEAAALIGAARQAAAGARPDVLAALAKAQQAHATADGVLGGIREAAAQEAREAAALQASLQAAEAGIARANDFIATRRAGVGREARTRLAEAERHLEAARPLVATEPGRAKSEADAAAALAAEAYRLAQSDFDDWDGRGGRRGDDLGPLLGGLIIGAILSGGRRGGGWGGTPWGMPGGGGGWGGGGFGGGGHGGGGGWGGGGRGGGGGW